MNPREGILWCAICLDAPAMVKCTGCGVPLCYECEGMIENLTPEFNRGASMCPANLQRKGQRVADRVPQAGFVKTF